MRAIILAAGEGTRMRPLTYLTPKPLLKVGDKELLVHLLEEILQNLYITSIAIVSGHKSEQVVRRIGTHFSGVPIIHAIQEHPTGTYDAALLGAHALGVLPHDEILIAHADDLQDGKAFRRAIAYRHSIVTAHCSDPRPYGVLVTDEEGVVLSIEEKPGCPKSNLVNTGGIITTPALFERSYAPQEKNGERYITDAVAHMLSDGVTFRTVIANRWEPVTTPEDLARLNA